MSEVRKTIQYFICAHLLHYTKASIRLRTIFNKLNIVYDLRCILHVGGKCSKLERSWFWFPACALEIYETVFVIVLVYPTVWAV